ncbi:dolichyl-phosphate beta-glucosyltransferase-like protein [Trifolium pratense]|uniref:dolichyl-phosphate beta-glucosyltransferase n=1 Tax=Trifolium pratense TaxID=57577 RepID=A0A2K3N4I8_TRIPR|nr:dolichyl-phosphate beta-glucosyltransferase-like protein [Trifolium pratense]
MQDESQLSLFAFELIIYDMPLVPCPHVVDPASKYISLIIPAFNEEYRLPGALEETMIYLQQRASKDPSFSYEVVIIDDGSTDGTKRVAFEFVRKYTVDKVRVILLGRNHGKGEAIRKGMLHSRGELLLMLDADGATKITDLEKLENQIRAVAKKDGDSSGSDPSFRISDTPVVVFGSRAHLEEKALATRKWYRNFLMKGFHLVVLLAAGPGVRDTQCGFKMFTRAAARKLFSNVRLKSYAPVIGSNMEMNKLPLQTGVVDFLTTVTNQFLKGCPAMQCHRPQWLVYREAFWPSTIHGKTFI